MTRTGSEDYRTEGAFLLEMKSLIARELADRARRLAEADPDLAGQVSSLIETPLERWSGTIDRGILAELHPLKLHDRLLDDLTVAIEQISLVVAIERRIAHLEREEMEITQEQPFGRYLLDAAYWRDDDALVALNNIFENWARWCRSEPLEVP